VYAIAMYNITVYVIAVDIEENVYALEKDQEKRIGRKPRKSHATIIRHLVQLKCLYCLTYSPPGVNKSVVLYLLFEQVSPLPLLKFLQKKRNVSKLSGKPGLIFPREHR
jgi:hypothetical protein